MIKSLHPFLVSLAVFLVAEVLISHQVNGYLYCFYPVLEIGFNYLLAPSGKFIKIQQAYSVDSLVSILPGGMTHPERSGNQYEKHDDGAGDCHCPRLFLSIFHASHPPFASFLSGFQVYQTALPALPAWTGGR